MCWLLSPWSACGSVDVVDGAFDLGAYVVLNWLRFLPSSLILCSLFLSLYRPASTGFNILPKSLAIALLAGIPPEYGLYTAIVSVLLLFVGI